LCAGYKGRQLTTKAVAAVEARGRLVALAPPLAGRRPDLDAAPGLLGALPPGRVRRVVGDRGLSAAWLRREVEARGAEPCLPANPRRPLVPCDRAAYERRHRVENLWARMKEFRAVAARYDKTAAAFRAGILIVATLDWLKA
jgi:transposase